LVNFSASAHQVFDARLQETGRELQLFEHYGPQSLVLLKALKVFLRSFPQWPPAADVVQLECWM